MTSQPVETTCKCGRFGDTLPHPLNLLPVLDFERKIVHDAAECYPFPAGAESEEDLHTHPATFGINRMGFFHEGEEHPEDCPCGGSRGYGVKKHGPVCFIGCHGTYAHIEHFRLDWSRQAQLALAPRRKRPETEPAKNYPNS